MRKIINLFLLSYHEIKRVSCITLLAMMGAISIILGYFTLMPVETIKITFNFLPNEFVYYLFGPAVGAVYGASLDILTFFIRPTGPFFFGFTVSAVLTGLWYGAVFYRRPLSLKRILVAKLIYTVTIHLLLNTYWLTQLYGYNFIALLPIRALKAVIMFPVETMLLYTLIKGAEATGVMKRIRNSEENQNRKTKVS